VALISIRFMMRVLVVCLSLYMPMTGQRCTDDRSRNDGIAA